MTRLSLCEHIPFFRGNNFDDARFHAILVDLLDEFFETAELTHRLGICQCDGTSNRGPSRVIDRSIVPLAGYLRV